MTWTLVHSTVVAGGPHPGVAAGQSVYDGWIDIKGLTWQVNAANFFVANNSSTPWLVPMLRSVAEAEVDTQIISKIQFNTLRNLYFTGRHNGSTTSASCYIAGITLDGSLHPVIVMHSIVNNVLGAIGSVGVQVPVTDGTEYNILFNVVQTNSTTTTITFTVSDLSGNQLATSTLTDTTAALQNVSGRSGFMVFTSGSGAGSGGDVAQVDTYADNVVPATAYSIVGSASGLQGLASTPFTIGSNGQITTPTNVTLSDGGAGGTFTPAVPVLPIGIISLVNFTYQPAIAGNITLSSTNAGGLTDPAPNTYTSVASTIVPVTSPAFKFSPGTWKGDTGRAGSVFRQSWNNGAYFEFNWNASASPQLVVNLPNSSTGCMLSYFLNGVLADNLAGNTSLTLTGIVPSAPNTLRVFLRNSPQLARWNNAVNVFKLLGITLDNASTVGASTVAPNWALIVGDSITEGIDANANTSDVLVDYSFLVGESLSGYEYGISACGSSGWLRPGDGAGDVPAYYVISGSTNGSGGTYNDATSRWNKIDAGVSLLDANGKISSYGQTNTQPSLIMINYMTNETISSSNVSDSQASVTQCITALRNAAPSATIAILVPFGLQYTGKYPNQAYTQALKAGVVAYQTANPFDSKVVLIDLGVGVAATIQNGIYINPDFVHPTAFGHALVAPKVSSALIKALTPAATAVGFTKYSSHL